LDRHDHGAAPRAGVTLLPPHVAHDGRPTTSRGFRTRVVYLEANVIPESLIGAAWHLAGRPPVPAPEQPVAVARRAREILDEDPVGIAGIACAHLNRHFRRLLATTPGRYRPSAC
jgi:AraC-like protein